MSTKERIISITNNLVLSRGYNAFSFADIAVELDIKKASIHYHFASKEQLGKALINQHIVQTREFFVSIKDKTPTERLLAFIDIYDRRKQHNQVCIVGSLGTDFLTLGSSMQEELKTLSDELLQGLIDILIDGKKENQFRFADEPRAKALMLTTNLLGGLQVTRLTGDADFEQIKRSILDNLLNTQ